MKRRVLVTGASGGIGSIVYTKLRLEERFDVTGQRWSTAAKGLLAFDLRWDAQVEELVGIAKPDIIVHCAGVSRDGMSWKLRMDEWADTMKINFEAAWLLAKHALPKMREQKWGRIIYISSVVGSVGVPGTCAYAASKAGLEGLCRAIASEVAGRNITVNCVAPGYIDPDYGGLMNGYPEHVMEACRKRIPLGRFGEPNDVAQAVRFLIDADWITGAVFPVNGGMR